MGQQVVGVAGSTGFVGRYVVRELLSRGHRVRALVRDLKKAGAVLPAHEALELVEGQAHTVAGASALARGADAIVNCVGIIRAVRGGQAFEQAHVDVPKRLTEQFRAALATKQPAGERTDEGSSARFVQISALGVTDNHPQGICEYQRSKFEGEMVVRRSGLSWTILRPGLIHGADGEFMQMAKGWATGRAAPYLFMPYFARRADGSMSLVPGKTTAPTISPVYVGDVAWAVGESLSRDQAVGEIFNLVGSESLTWPELLEKVRDTVPNGRKSQRVLGIPGPLAVAKARGLKLLGMDGLLPFDDGMALMGMRDSVAEPVKARTMLGFEPGGFRSTFEQYAPSMV